MNYSKIIPYDIVNGKGVRTTLFVSGCQFHCPGCFNPESWDFNYGKPFTGETFATILHYLRQPQVTGLSILGGEPLHQDDTGLRDLYRLCKWTHDLGKNVWLWTGYRVEEIQHEDFLRWQLISACDVIVDGRFEITQRDLSLPFRGSKNQRIIENPLTI